MNKTKETSLDLVLDAVDRQIRHARADLARIELEKIFKKPVPRAKLARVGQLLCRSGMPLETIKLLHKIIHPKGKNMIAGTAEEKSEYAAALTFIGANDEAFALLKGVDTKTYPRALLYQGFSLFSRWEYGTAIPVLKQYCSTPGLSLYNQVVADLNLAAALVHEAKEYSSTKTSLDRILSISAQERFRFLEGIAFETSAQNEFFNGKDEEALRYLNRAEELLSEGQSNDGLFVEKWKAIIQVKNPTSRKVGLVALEKVRIKAREHSHWETVRDCDRFEALYTKNAELLLSVYFGTPYPAFKTEITRQGIFPFSPPALGYWTLSSGKKKAIDIEASTVERLAKDPGSKPSQLMGKLFRTLTSDFYRPWGVPSLFAKLYPEEFFNPLSSPARVHRAIQRLRLWFKEVKLPLGLEEEYGFYRMEANAPVRILLSSTETDSDAATITKLAGHFQGKAFSVSEAASILEVSKRTALRILNTATEDAKLLREGGGRSTVYRVASK